MHQLLSQTCEYIELLDWFEWQAMHEPTTGLHKGFFYYTGTGIYQLRNVRTGQKILVGTGGNCNDRMKSLYKGRYGSGTRNNTVKSDYVHENWRDIQFRILPAENILKAEFIETALLAAEDHMFNT